MKKLSISIITSVLIAAFVFACKKKEDVTPVRDLSQGTSYSIAELNALATCTNACARRFNSEAYLTVIVAADEVSGNLYKELYVQDNSGSLHLSLTDNSNFLIGDKIRINLKGLDVGVNSLTKMIEIDSINFEKQIIKTESSQPVTIKPVSLSALLSPTASVYYSQLVSIPNMEFVTTDTSKIWSDPITKNSVNLTLKDCSGSTMIVRSSGYAKFAGQKVPKGNGTVIAIVSNYSTTKQLVIRNASELNLTGPRCP
jgi:hypothetical protein